MKPELKPFFTSKKYLPLLFVLFFVFVNCKKKESKYEHIIGTNLEDSTAVAYATNDTIDPSTEEDIKKKEEFLAFVTEFLEQEKEDQSIDTLNVKVEAAMGIYANDHVFKDKKFVETNDLLVRYIESQNEAKVAESFYTAGLMESYGYFSDVDGHAINEFKTGAKLGSVNCVKYLTIIYFERVLYKHNATSLCDPVCMTHRGRNYIEETSLASLNKNDILKFTTGSNDFLLKTIGAHLNKKMSDNEISNYVTHLRTYSNPILKLNDMDFQQAFSTFKVDSNSDDTNTDIAAFTAMLDNNDNITIADIAELYTFNYPAYENDAKFLFWVKMDLEKLGIDTFDEFVDKYKIDDKYGIIDFGSRKILVGLLKYFISKGDTKSETALQEVMHDNS